MTDTTPTNMTHHPEPVNSEHARQQASEDQSGPSCPEAQQRATSSSGQRTAPVRMPLFRS